MSWVPCFGYRRCKSRVRQGQKSFNGWCYRCRRQQAQSFKTKGPFGCVFCTEPKRLTMCGPCSRSYDRALEKDGSVMNVLLWAAQRVRRYERHRARTLQQVRVVSLQVPSLRLDPSLLESDYDADKDGANNGFSDK